MQPLFDTDLLLARKLRALRSRVDGADFLMARVAEDLAERLATVERKFKRAIAVFCTTDDAARVLMESGKVGSVVRVERDPALLGTSEGIVASAEVLPIEPESADLAVSLLAFQEINDLPGLLFQIRRALKPDGLLLAAMAGGETLRELRECLLIAETELTGGAAPRVAPFTDVRDAGALLQRAGFALPVADIEIITVRYAHLFALMADLRAMGATNALMDRSRRPVSLRLFTRAAEIYAERFADPDGRIRATFSIVWLSGWAPDASQPKPLKPGSAQVSLTQVLK
ncbi:MULTISPECIES: methyltransferase domain-containing protein [Mesorhizobium]|uniref:Methyltransferase domain-containing protein n=1 Tax=Mesorhizobium denitrificans TaxID=2294114 RepID=A0A371XFK8_9HYPH|nr:MULTISPECIES: methyltransferase domain-containing protein [Mesorhizobium]RFC68009.1 methyltransferase domain-containing protein [Mesorhizobium denitrificans]